MARVVTVDELVGRATTDRGFAQALYEWATGVGGRVPGAEVFDELPSHPGALALMQPAALAKTKFPTLLTLTTLTSTFTASLTTMVCTFTTFTTTTTTTSATTTTGPAEPPKEPPKESKD
ncbi:MAG: hypothetical protein IT380_11770 [Myxococcales bacterium]|nr:hypothetical protein [Myxococcales bacterium]